MSYQPKSNRKFYATALTTAVVASAVAPAAVSADHVFSDVKDGEYYSNAVQYLADNAILQGPGDGTFNPDGEIIRASAAEVLMKAQGIAPGGSEDFSDVDEDDWFYNAVRATSPAIFEGNNGEFSPQDNLTREQAAAILVRAYGLTGDTDHDFPDVKEGSWAEDEIAIAAENGIIEGNEKGEFMPKDNVTRKDFAVMVYRALGVVDNTEVIDATTINVTLSNGKETVINLDEPLVDGDNEVTFTIDGKEFTVTVNYEADTEAPELTVEGLEDESTVQESTVTFTVEATDNEDEEVTPVVTLGEEEVEANEDGSYTVELEEGENTVTVTAVDEAGNEATEEYTVTYDATVANATLAVEAYEELTVETYADYIEATEALQAAEEALELVEDEEVTAELQARLDAQTEAVDTVLSEVVDSVNNASNQVELNDALTAFFNNVNSDLIEAYQGALDGTEETVEEIQVDIDTQNAVADVLAADTQVELLDALQSGEENGVFSDVREDYIETYATNIIDVSEVDTAEEIQAIIDGATQAVVDNAIAQLEEAEANPSDDAELQEAVDAVAAVPSDLVDDEGNSILDTLQERLDNVSVVNDVLAADQVSQVRLLESLNENGFENVNTDYIAEYDAAIDGSQTVEEIQTVIDRTNSVEAAIDGIDALPSVEDLTLEDADDVAAVRELVTTATDRDDVVEGDITNLDELAALEAQLGELEDQVAIDAATEAIDALPAVEDLTLEDADAVEAARELVTTATDRDGVVEGDITNLGELAALEAELVDLEAEAELDAIVTAETAAELEPLLVELESDAFNNLTTVQRLEVSELFLETLANNEYDSLTAVTEALEAEVGVEAGEDTEATGYYELLFNVNNAGSITEMDGALTTLDLEEYEALSAAEQLEVAENVLNNAPEGGYTSISEIVANF
ncbi:S-layer homology domain-containing protein [Halobacillus dabanensis]|uniref:S-layer homology domain-containing protein n=1 Tax=Halobacillus dabanensis TaxID=240302 RepID=A0A1I3XEL5_HALDA|nr:S-layer homology domain-containing protein [Halobacillus dabanensis]SFK17965.1 S-layer homology domain-containing protein [Halobacillus dabanensis]